MTESEPLEPPLPGDPLEQFARQRRERHDRYMQDVLESRPFQDGLRYLESIRNDFLFAQTAIRFMGLRFRAEETFLLFRFAPHVSESAIAITANAKEGLQNAARRELRFLIEVAVKLSSRDSETTVTTIEDRLLGLDDRGKKFEDYVADLQYLEGFTHPEEANAAILSLYSELSRYVHATAPQFEDALKRAKRDEDPGMESVSTLNRFNQLAFQVYDLVLVRLFYGVGLSLAGDIFTGVLDDMPKWRFHKGKFVERMSRCFDYKHERRVRRGEI